MPNGNSGGSSRTHSQATAMAADRTQANPVMRPGVISSSAARPSPTPHSGGYLINPHCVSAPTLCPGQVSADRPRALVATSAVRPWHSAVATHSSRRLASLTSWPSCNASALRRRPWRAEIKGAECMTLGAADFAGHRAAAWVALRRRVGGAKLRAIVRPRRDTSLSLPCRESQSAACAEVLPLPLLIRADGIQLGEGGR